MPILFVRTLILYTMVITALRLMGKRQIGEMQPSELVVSIMISDLASIPMSDTSIPLMYGIVPIFTLVVAELIISSVLLKNLKIRRIVTGVPSIIVSNGQILQKEMKKQRFNISDLTEQLRLQGYYDLSEVDTVMLETNGQLTVIPKPQNKAPTLGDLNIKSSRDSFPVVIISEGKIMYKNLKSAKISQSHIMKVLKKHNIQNERDVYFMTFYKNEYFIQKKQTKGE